MRRRRQQSGLEMLIEIAALLPWWLALTIASGAYVALHYYATATEPPPTDLAALGSFAGRQIFRTAAMFFQYLAPGILVVGAVVSAVQRSKLQRRFDDTKSRGTRGALLDMSWQEFEGLVGEHFRRQGYGVTQIGGDGPDGGVDLELHKGSELVLVQCKQWRATKVGVEVVRQLYGVMAARGAAGGFVVTSGDFTVDAQSFSAGRNISLLDGKRLITSITAERDTLAVAAAPPQPVPQSSSTPECPKCRVAMVRRVARQGPRAGEAFWGCSRYPKCNGIRPT